MTMLLFDEDFNINCIIRNFINDYNTNLTRFCRVKRNIYQFAIKYNSYRRKLYVNENFAKKRNNLLNVIDLFLFFSSDKNDY